MPRATLPPNNIAPDVKRKLIFPVPSKLLLFVGERVPHVRFSSGSVCLEPPKPPKKKKKYGPNDPLLRV